MHTATRTHARTRTHAHTVTPTQSYTHSQTHTTAHNTQLTTTHNSQPTACTHTHTHNTDTTLTQHTHSYTLELVNTHSYTLTLSLSLSISLTHTHTHTHTKLNSYTHALECRSYLTSTSGERMVISLHLAVASRTDASHSHRPCREAESSDLSGASWRDTWRRLYGIIGPGCCALGRKCSSPCNHAPTPSK